MKILRQEPSTPPLCPRCYAATIRIRVFKGRRDVLVHLFRPVQEEQESLDCPWDTLIRAESEQQPVSDRGDSKAVIMEAFVREELDALVAYLSGRYAERLTAMTTTALEFPLPPGLLPFGAIPEGKDMGRIRFEIVPGYSLPFTVHGFYDLSLHKPMDQGD